MKSGHLHRYWTKFKARRKHYKEGLYLKKKGGEKDAMIAAQPALSARKGT